MKTIRIFILCVMILFGNSLFAQRGHGVHGKKGHGRTVVVARSPYRPANVVVYHPYWRPAYTYHRRWVYFPRYNVYWDNWRNHYVFWDGGVWISQPTAPSILVNVNLNDERNIELGQDEDDVDEIYRSNESHKKANP